MTDVTPALAQSLAEVRKSLLDLTRRNRLLNLGKRGRGALQIVDEVPEFVWRRLVLEGKAFDFRAREESEVPIAGDPEPAAPESATGANPVLDLAPVASQKDVASAERHRDRWLQTPLAGPQLQAQLLHLAREARVAQDEQGTNVLYLALGIVRWREPGATDVVSTAPLLFVPVALERKDVHSRHALTTSDEDVVLNPCFLELCERIFATKLDLALPEPDQDLAPWLERAKAAVTAIEGLEFAPEVWLGLFSFSKLAMHADLAPERWPATTPLAAHPLLGSLLGTGTAAFVGAGDAPIDPEQLDKLPPEKSWLVVDADSSQETAVRTALLGRSLVIEGPPGTGKSQTITNLIAEFLAAGKTVLFVAEKAAALEVVQRRLQAVGLDECVLEMHSRTKSKRAVLDELERAIAGATDAPAAAAPADEVQRLRTRLDEHAKALHTPFGALAVSAYSAMTRAVAQREAPESTAELRELVLWTKDDLALASEGLATLDARLARFRSVPTRPWRGAAPAAADFATKQAILRTLEPLRSAAGDLAQGARAFGAESLQELAAVGSGDAVTGASHALVQERAAARAAWRERFGDTATAFAEPGAFAARRRTQAKSLFRMVSPSWYREGKELRALVKPGLLDDGDADLKALDALQRDRDLSQEIAATIAKLEAPFRAAWDAFVQAASIDAEAFFGAARDAVRFTTLETRIAPLPAAIEELQDEVDFVQARRTCASPRIAPFVAWALSEAAAPARGQLTACFERHFWRLFADAALAVHEGLRSFVGEDHEALLKRFQTEDRRFLEATRARLLAKVRMRRPDLDVDADKQSKLGILKAELRKKRRNLALRRLFEVAGDVILRLKPCLLMSPISVAQHLAPGGIAFDVVIFDEASQVTPADALGAIARGKQVILVGDEKQLPPTAFFEKLESADVATEEAVDPGAIARDLPSILSLGFAKFPRAQQCMLRWHYRSRHQSLIEFSNASFYSGLLRTFPSPQQDRSELGLVFRFVENGVYQRGQGQHNPVEARVVAEAVLEHARKRRKKTLGVGAFSVAQQRAIEDELERLLRDEEDPEVERFLTGDTEEPFFVKNLETIQGDERDVIFLSVGYGKDQAGKVAMNFGPLNQDGGWRRLNVLVTRARERCVLYASIRSSDLDLGKTQARGVQALKEYLHLAEHGTALATSAPRGDHDSPLEAAIAQALREKGHEVHAQIGAAGFSIDLAIVDPAHPGRYLLGIECDGATYHSSPTARDRDRLREEVLRRLGWRIVRVWSTDWFKRRERAFARLVQQVDEAKALRVAPVVEPTPPPPEAPAAEAPAKPVPKPKPVVAASAEEALTLALREEFGMQREGLLRSAARRLGYERLGPRIKKEIEMALDTMTRAGKVTTDASGFLVLAG